MISKRFRTAIAVFAGFAASVIWSGAAYGGYRFEDPTILNLSAAERLAPLEQGDPIAATPLAAAAAAAIVAAPELGEDAPGQVPILDGEDKAARKQEKPRIAAEAPAVQRNGKKLSIKPQTGSAVEFVDTSASKNSDGDSETFIYAGRIGAEHYHHVEERFQQDAPDSYFINPASGKIVSAHNGADVVELSSDGKWLLSLSRENPPFLLAVAALDGDGPHLALVCHGSASSKISAASFKGWHNENSFDLALTPGAPGETAGAAIPLRIALDGQSWHPAAVSKDLERIGYSCKR